MIVKKLKAASPKYKTIKDAIDALQNLGFCLETIQLQAEHEPYTAPINFWFCSFEDFVANAHDSFRKHAEEVGDSANVDWSRTTFILINAETNRRIHLFIDECNGNMDPQESILLIMDDENGKDHPVVESVLCSLAPFFVEE